MALLTLDDARKLAARNRPWTFRLEFKGLNAANQSGRSEKFWLATGRGVSEPVEIHYGAIGSTGTVLVKTWSYVEQVAPEKLTKGYQYADTPYKRVQQSTIDAFNAAMAKQPPPSTAPVTSVAAPPAPPPTPAPTTNGLAGPYGRIVSVSSVGGVWKALDAAGKVLLTLTAQGARDLVTSNPHIVVAGLGG